MTTYIPYDKNWKEITTQLTSDFIEFFLPDLFKMIDFSVPFEHLEQELHSLLEQKDKANKRRKTTDKLVKVKLLDHTTHWIYVHTEFQGANGQNICERMYRYYRRIEERYGSEITALVIYTGTSVPKVNNEYRKEFFETTIIYKFRTYEVRKQSVTELENSTNPFALVVLANLHVINTKKDAQQRLEYKKRLFELTEKANYTKTQALFLHYFVSELMLLPDDLEEEFDNFSQSSTKLTTNNMKLSQRTKDLTDAMAIGAFGISVTEAQNQMLTTQQKLTSMIVRCYTKGMSIDEIADLANEEPKKIYTILLKEKLIVE
jgi:hypothetical protein